MYLASISVKKTLLFLLENTFSTLQYVYVVESRPFCKTFLMLTSEVGKLFED